VTGVSGLETIASFMRLMNRKGCEGDADQASKRCVQIVNFILSLPDLKMT